MAIGGGQQWDDKAQGTLTQPQGLFDIQTQQFIDMPSSSSGLPNGMTRQVTANQCSKMLKVIAL